MCKSLVCVNANLTVRCTPRSCHDFLTGSLSAMEELSLPKFKIRYVYILSLNLVFLCIINITPTTFETLPS
jgi:hypothetical protein